MTSNMTLTGLLPDTNPTRSQAGSLSGTLSQVNPPDLKLAATTCTSSITEAGGRRLPSSMKKKTSLNAVVLRSDPSSSIETKDLYLFNYEKYQERIIRSSYVFDLSLGQSIEAGVERAQTIVDTSLRLGLLAGVGGQEFGGLTPVTSSVGTVEEMRLEYFTIHNWSMNDRMTLETTLLVEDSSISQSGNLANSRDFHSFRPKVDYRFDITPSIQFRGIVQKIVNQLSFRDFTAGVDQMDDEQNSFEGNSDIQQMSWWNYEANLEYRLPNDAGVINTQLYYQTVFTLSTMSMCRGMEKYSARGNTGDGRRYGLNLNNSLRLDF